MYVTTIATAFGDMGQVSAYDLVRALTAIASTPATQLPKITAYLRNFLRAYRDQIFEIWQDTALKAEIDADPVAQDAWSFFECAVSYKQIRDAFDSLAKLGPSSEEDEWESLVRASLRSRDEAASSRSMIPPPTSQIKLSGRLRSAILRKAEEVILRIVLQLDNFPEWAQEANRVQTAVNLRRGFDLALHHITYIMETGLDANPILSGVTSLTGAILSLPKIAPATQTLPLDEML
ncbi:hypothetical protein CAOG_009375 [Capsaspora owczarzaki ATCC 30864]|uniref:Uncharacterized protein n=1 Tax=Capsaspora owczarzaki (strain ATCC 30864) TaxID=595528 RepID=A0A0D2X0T0_CAPO3|nr:hypothetical protein CAOG_009375 [Capsaspora owczarzaki ATCC 30864]